jgi:putative colanic acid biosynthesis UDP-glucose lipid carrier transferase
MATMTTRPTQLPRNGGGSPIVPVTKADLLLVHAPAFFDFRSRGGIYFSYLGTSGDVPITPLYEYFPVGFKTLQRYLGARYDDRAEERRTMINHPRWSVIGRFDDLVRDCHEGKLDVVYGALPLRAEERTGEILATHADTTVTVHLVADFLYCSLLRAQWGQVGGVAAASLHDSPFSGLVGWVKRVEDVVIGSFIVLLTSILMLLIAVAIKLESPGPVIFRQWRNGLSGKRIRIVKFRTMNVCEDGADVVQAVKDDVRVTKLGKFLRRTSLDEFPQLLQVLTGELSLVGPRPHAVAHNEKYRAILHGYMLRHMVKPGITGWAQVNGWRGETAELVKMEERVRHDMEYIRNWNLVLDLKIIFLTVFGAKKSRNAC